MAAFSHVISQVHTWFGAVAICVGGSFFTGDFVLPLCLFIFSSFKILYTVDSDPIYSPSSASFGTICDGAKSAYLGSFTVLIILARSSLVNLFLGIGLLVRGL